MRISKIENVNYVYEVTFTPYFIERIFGVKPKTKKYKDTGNTYTFGSGHVYVDQNGSLLGNGNHIGDAIDKYRRRF